MKYLPALLLATLCHLAAAQTTQTTQLHADHVPGRGVALVAANVPLSRGSSIQLYAPGWTQGYYSSNAAKAKAATGTDASEHRVEHRSANVGFTATEIVRTSGPKRIDWSLDGNIATDNPVRLEWGLVHFNAFVLYGGSHTWPATTRPTTVLPEPLRNEPNATPVATGKQIVLDSSLGRLTFAVEEGGIELALLDGRRLANSAWAQEAPSFWLGVRGADLRSGVPIRLRVSVTLEPRETKTAPDVTALVPAVATDRAFAATSGPPHVIPKPKSMRLEDGRFTITPDTSIVVVHQSAMAGARSLAKEVEERLGWRWNVYGAESARATANTILFAPAPSGTMPAEGYSIECTPNGLTVRADDNAGYFYAAQTLAQLIQVEDAVIFFPECRIDDSPSLPFRGVHLFPGKDAMPMHRRLIERVLARHKMNHVVLEADYTQWATDPKIWTDISVPKQQIAEYVRTARENMLEPIPLVQSLGHMEWMFKNGQNLDLAEDPETPYAYSATNPKTYEFIESVYAEALALFQPKWFHIGHDEVAMRGRYPHRETAREWGEEKLFLYDTHRLHDWLKEKGVGTMMWGDVLLAREESSDPAANAKSVADAQRIRAALPKDTVICDWHYTPVAPEKYKSLDVLRDAGFRTIACTWFTPSNIHTFAEAARQNGAWGLLQTTWAGYSITEKTLRDAPHQFAAYVLAAEYAWSADSPSPADLPWSAQYVFDQAMRPSKMAVGVRPGRMLNLSAVGGFEDLGEEFLGLGNALVLDRIHGDAPKSNHSFWSTGGSYPAIVLNGALVPDRKPRPTSVTIRPDTPLATHQLAFLHATLHPAPAGDVVGTYELVYDDDTTVPLPLRYGQETRALTDPSPTSPGRMAWSGRTASGLPAALRVLQVENPKPHQRITAIRFSTHHPYASPILFGVTAVD